MKPANWERVRELFELALERPEHERASFLSKECSDDRALMDEVSSLLEADSLEANFIEAGLLPFGNLLDPEGGLEAGARVGPYSIVREIGRGGMGTVYLASRADGSFEREVALKLLAGAVVRQSMVHRFDHERQILASLEHPYIARLYDAGVSEEGPYLAMEYVDGEPVDAHCDETRWGIEQRIDLFILICDAVEHAHGQLILHRDLKPSNIIVDSEGRPHLLDFGIAKLLDGDGITDVGFTRTGVRPLTPDYASPEQLLGERLSVASDVYSLAVVLHELLTGRRPSRSGGEPTLPSRLVTGPHDERAASEIAGRRGLSTPQFAKRLRGDLDQIVLKGLAHDVENRYGSAAALADDLKRFRSGLPVLAHAPSLGYRARKFAQRNARTVAASVAVVTALSVGLGVATYQAGIAADERDAATSVADFLEDLISAPNPAGGEFADTTRLADFFDVAAERVRTELSDQPRTQARLLTVIGRVYQNLGRGDLAEPVLKEAVAANRSVSGDRSEETLETSRRLGMVLSEVGKIDESKAVLQSAIDAASAQGPEGRLMAARIQETLARTHLDNREPSEAAPLLEAALPVMRDGLEPEDPLIGRTIATLAAVSHQLGDYRRAIELQEESLVRARARGGPPIRYAISHLNLSMLYSNQGETESALTHAEEGLQIIQDALEEPHWQIAAARMRLANVLEGVERTMEADSLYALAIEGFRQTPEGLPNLPYALQDHAQLLTGLNRLAEAETAQREVVSLMEAQYGSTSPQIEVVRPVLATILFKQGRTQEAERMILASITVLEEHEPRDHQSLAYAVGEHARMLIARGAYAEAVDRLQPLIAEAEPILGPAHPQIEAAKKLLAESTGADPADSESR